MNFTFMPDDMFDRERAMPFIEYSGRSGWQMYIDSVTSLFATVWDWIANGAKLVSRIATSFVSFTVSLYLTIPPALEKLCNWFDTFLHDIQTLYSSDVVQSTVSNASESFNQLVQQNSSTLSLWDWVKYSLNSDVFIASIQAFASISFLWVELTVVLFLVIVALLVSAFSAYGLRKALSLFTMGYVKA